MMPDPNPVIRTLIGSPYRTLEEFFSQNGTKAQLFTINPARHTTIVGKKGTRLTFFPFSLCDVFGNPVQGEVEIKMTEICSRSEMIKSDKPATSEDRLLETAGQFYIQASQNFLPLELKRPAIMEIPVSAALRNPLGMRLYAGSTSSTRSFSSDKVFDWKLTGQKPVKVKKLREKKYFSFELDAFHWISCNYLFARRASRTMVSAKMTGAMSELDDQAAFLVFKELNAVARMYPSGNKFTIFNVPVNMPVQVLIMGLHHGQLYFGRTNIGKTSSQLVPVAMQPVSERTLLDAVEEW